MSYIVWHIIYLDLGFTHSLDDARVRLDHEDQRLSRSNLVSDTLCGLGVFDEQGGLLYVCTEADLVTWVQ